jgi:hypothetical protein
MVIVAAVFGAVLTGSYLHVDINSSRVAVRSEAHHVVLVAHIFAACIALVLGPLQFIPTIPAVLWLITGALAYRAARHLDHTTHQDWMMRDYALTFLAVTSRILVPLLLLAELPFTGASAGSLDVGCLQGFDPDQRLATGRGVTALARPGATLLILACGLSRWQSFVGGCHRPTSRPRSRSGRCSRSRPPRPLRWAGRG